MYGSASADKDKFASAVECSLDRKVCNTLNVCCVSRKRAAELVPAALGAVAKARVVHRRWMWAAVGRELGEFGWTFFRKGRRQFGSGNSERMSRQDRTGSAEPFAPPAAGSHPACAFGAVACGNGCANAAPCLGLAP